jgi:hypothetical protein
MPSIHETAYPCLKAAVTARDLAEVYTPTPNELELARRTTRSATAQGCFVMLLKTFQRLGYFVRLRDVPLPIVRHIAEQLDVVIQPQDLRAYDASGSRRRHVAVIREYLQVKPYGGEAQQFLSMVIREAARTKEELTDLINIGIEELVRQRFELPVFGALRRTAQLVRAAVNREVFEQVAKALGPEGRRSLDAVLAVDVATGQAPGT